MHIITNKSPSRWFKHEKKFNCYRLIEYKDDKIVVKTKRYKLKFKMTSL